MNVGELWYVPNSANTLPVTPVLVDKIANLPMGIVEIEPDIFYISTLAEPTLERFDLRGWTPGTPVKRERVLTLPAPAMRLNGVCLIGPNVVAVADCAAGLIWRVDFTDKGRSAKASIWLPASKPLDRAIIQFVMHSQNHQLTPFLRSAIHGFRN